MSPSSHRTKISVLVITYNHEKYLSQALESILSQKVEAELEVIIADDNSTDNTLAIAHDYKKRFPEVIQILTTDKNIGHTHNYERAWKKATGEYIAHCDGDDYWLTTNKLSAQLSFLEANPHFSTCSHQIWAIFEEDGAKHGPLPRTDQTVFSTNDLLEACFPHNCSLLFRNRLFTELPPFFHELTGHDWCVDILNSLHGPIKILPEIMGVWRIRSKGLWGGRQPTFHWQHGILFLSRMKEMLPEASNKALRRSLNIHWFKLTQEYLKLNETSEGIKSLSHVNLFEGFLILPKRQLVSVIAQLKFPVIYLSLKRMRDFILGSAQPNT